MFLKRCGLIGKGWCRAKTERERTLMSAQELTDKFENHLNGDNGQMAKWGEGTALQEVLRTVFATTWMGQKSKQILS